MNPAGLPLPRDGRWCVGVSGGADSVALLRLCLDRSLDVRVLHLDHATRAGGSAADAAWVAGLCRSLGVECVVGRYAGDDHTPAGHRAARLAFFREHVGDRAGVMLAHHAGDQAETVLLRLIRGTSALHLRAMRPTAEVAGLTLARPLLNVEPEELRAYLRSIGQPWREDASNAVGDQRRNRHRRTARRLRRPLLDLAAATAAWHAAVAAGTPTLPPEPTPADLPPPGPRRRLAVRRWLQAHAVPDLTPSVVARATAAIAERSHTNLPGGHVIRPTRGRVAVHHK